MTPISAHTSPVRSRSSPARLLKFLPARLETLASTQPAHTSCLPAPLACAPRINRLPIAACSGSCLLMPPPLTTHGLQSASRAHDLALPYHADTSPPVRPAPGPDSDSRMRMPSPAEQVTSPPVRPALGPDSDGGWLTTSSDHVPSSPRGPARTRITKDSSSGPESPLTHLAATWCGMQPPIVHVLAQHPAGGAGVPATCDIHACACLRRGHTRQAPHGPTRGHRAVLPVSV